MRRVRWPGFAKDLRRLIFGALFITLLQPAPAYAFDTGHHNDLTRAALSRFGFSDTAIKVVQLENWLVDYYSQHPSPLGALLIGEPSVRIVHKQMDKLHFDNIFSVTDLMVYWARLRVNTRDAVQQAVRDQNVLQFLTVIGQTLHAVQDFYTHSNWVEKHPRAPGQPYRTNTWFNTSVLGMDLYTGAYPNLTFQAREIHGVYDVGLNKDSYTRQFDPTTSEIRPWDEAYVFAYIASCEWINAIHLWTEQAECDPNYDMWQEAQEYELTRKLKEKLEHDLRASYALSLNVLKDEHNGHWKGIGSGSVNRLVKSFSAWQSRGHSPFVSQVLDQWGKTSGILSSGLYEGFLPIPSDVPEVPPLVLRETAIMIRTLRVNEVDPSGPERRKDFYARIKVASNEPFVESVQRNWRNKQLAWATIQFVPSTTQEAPISYSLRAENVRFFRFQESIVEDTHEDINTLSGNPDLVFIFNLANNECIGLGTPLRPCGTESSPFTVQWPSTSGFNPDGARASVSFFVTSTPLVPRQ